MFPTSVCDHCQYVINTFHIFLLKCQKKDQELQDTILNTKTTTLDTTTNCLQKTEKIDSEDEGTAEYLLEEYDDLLDDVKQEIVVDGGNEVIVGDEGNEEIVVDEGNEEVNIEFLEETNENHIEEMVNVVEKKNTENENVQAEDATFSCDLCRKTFTSKEFLTNHYVCHAGVRRACPRPGCNKKYASLSALKQHERTIHLGILGKYMCATCGK